MCATIELRAPASSKSFFSLKIGLLIEATTQQINFLKAFLFLSAPTIQYKPEAVLNFLWPQGELGTIAKIGCSNFFLYSLYDLLTSNCLPKLITVL